MTTSCRSGWWKLGRGCALAMGGAIVAVCGDEARAQITPDTTLGTESSVVTPNVIIRDVPSDRIDGGAKSGANLFHSFQEFNIGEGRGAYFTNPIGIENILSRVTGGNVSNILGKLGVLGNANLFLINPNGLIFGPNARLDIRGSFVGSTASAVNFADGTQFSATAPSATPLLTVSVPLGLQYVNNAGSVQVQQSILQVQNSQTLALIGGDVSVEGGQFGFLQAPGGRIELGGLTGAGIVEIEGQQSTGAFGLTSLRFPEQVERADVSLTNFALVDVAAGGGGSIAINARNLEVLGGVFGESLLRAGIASGMGSPEATAGDITLNATGEITVGQSSRIENNVNTDATGNSGNINISAGALSLSGRAKISDSTSGTGNAGTLSVRASDAVEVSESSGLFAQVNSGATGNGGNLTIDTGRLSVRDGAAVSVNTFGQGRGGNLTVNASKLVELIGSSSDGQSFSRLASETFDTADAGNVTIATGQLLVQGGAFVSTGTRPGSQGQGGTLAVTASDLVELSGRGGLFTQTEGSGDGGDLTIDTGRLSIGDGAIVSAFTLGAGDAGNLTVRTSESVELSGRGGLFTQTEGGGDGGDLTIDTGRLSLRDGAIVSADTYGQGNAGNLLVHALDSVEVVGTDADRSVSYLTANVNQGARGNGGNLTIDTSRLSVRDGAQVSASTFSEGDAGNLTVRASDSVELSGESPLYPGGLLAQVDYEGVGNGGNLNIETRRLSVSDGSKVQVSTFGLGNSGDLTIHAADIDVFETPIDNFFSTGIFAENAQSDSPNSPNVLGLGKGIAGNLIIETESLRIRNGGQVSASTFGIGNAGNLTVRASDSIEVSGIEDVSAFGGSRGGRRSVSLLAADVRQGATGRGGNLKIETGQLKIDNEARISVSAFNESGTAGNLDVKADSIRLDRGTITAVTASGEGGNINLNIDDTLFMRNNSQISAEALNDANGGNVIINAPNGFVVAFPNQNNDIVANAAQGRGGNININAASIFGIKERPLNPVTNDINASSEFGLQGNISINTLDVDPSRGLVTLSAQLVEASRLIATGCAASEKNKFIVTGRGGLPPNPGDTLSGEAVLVNWATLDPEVENRSSAAETATNPTRERAPTQIVEAQGWVFGPKGEVILTASAPIVTPHSAWLPTVDCSN